MAGPNNSMESLIRRKLTDYFNPKHLEIVNESYMHNVPKGSETHFKVLVVSDKFENVSLLQVGYYVSVVYFLSGTYLLGINFPLVFTTYLFSHRCSLYASNF